MKILQATSESFNSLLDFLEGNGNPVLGKRWRVDKEGLHTSMTKPLDLNLIKNNFQVADDVEVNEDYAFFSTKREWMDIFHSPRLRYDPRREGFGDAYYWSDDNT